MAAETVTPVMVLPLAEKLYVRFGAQFSRVMRAAKSAERSSCLSVMMGQLTLGGRVSWVCGGGRCWGACLQSDHLLDDCFCPGLEQRELCGDAVDDGGGRVDLPHVGLVEHEARHAVNTRLSVRVQRGNTHGSCRSPNRWRVLVLRALSSRALKSPLPAEVSIHSCVVQSGRSQLKKIVVAHRGMICKPA